jgi:hypothetical protein
MTAPTNPYAAPATANPYAAPASAPATAPANPYAAAPVVAPVAPAAAPAPAPAAPAPAGIDWSRVGAPATAPTTAPAPAGGDPFGDPAPREARGPRLQEMAGRLILITPKLTERVLSRDPKRAGEYETRMTADVVILDGGPCAYGGKPEGRPPTPHDKVAQLPHRNRDMYISSVGLVSQCREALEKRQRGEAGMVLGRLGYGEQSDPTKAAPWLLMAATDADKTLARAYLATVDPFGN